MSSNQINTLTSGTINGLNSLALDELTTTNLTAGTMDGDLFFIDRIEANEVIVDTQLRLTSTGVFSVGAVTISDIELTYLDGVSSNIQTQINNINTNTSGLATTVATHTTQIAALEASDTTQNTTLATHTSQISALQTSDTSQNTTLATHTSQISALQTSDTSQNTTLATHTSQISAIQTVNATQTTDINNLNFAVTGQATTLTTHTSQISALQTSDTTQNANISNLQSSDTTQNTTLATHTAQISALQTSDATQNTNITNLQASDTTQNTNITNLQTNVSALQTSDTTQNTNITTLQTKTQNITATSIKTMTDKRLVLNNSGEVLEMTGTHSYISGYDSSNNNRDFYIGTPFAGNKNLTLAVERVADLVLQSGTDNVSTNPIVYGRTKIQTYSKGLQFYRKQTVQVFPPVISNIYGGEIGLLGNDSDQTLYINSNQTGGIYMSSGTGLLNLVSSGIIELSSTDVRVGSSSSSLSFLEGGSWVAQSSAFTEALKTQLIALQNAKIAAQTAVGRTQLTQTHLLGRTFPLTNSTNYPSLTHEHNLGIRLNQGGYSSYFNASGQWIYNGGATQRVSIKVDCEFNSGLTGIKTIVSRILIKTSGGAAIVHSRPQGVRYSAAGGNPLNSILYWSTGEFVFNIQNLNTITLETENFFSTSSDGSTRSAVGHLQFFLLPY